MSRWPIAFVACAIACSGTKSSGTEPLPPDVQAVLDFNGHVVVVSHDTFVHYRDVVASARALDSDVVAAQPFDYLEVMAINGDRRAQVAVKGVPADATGDAAVTDYARYLVAGRSVEPWRGADEPIDVVMGSELGRQLHARIGDTLTLVVPLGDGTDDKEPRSTKARVVGVTYVPMIEYNDRLLITSLPVMQQLRGHGDAVMGVELRVRHREAAPRVARALGEKLGTPYQVMDWCELNKSLWKAMGRRCP